MAWLAFAVGLGIVFIAASELSARARRRDDAAPRAVVVEDGEVPRRPADRVDQAARSARAIVTVVVTLGVVVLLAIIAMLLLGAVLFSHDRAKGWG
jgi:hypothetical protein